MLTLNQLMGGATLNNPSSARIIQDQHEQNETTPSKLLSEDDALSYLAQVLVDAYLEQRKYARNQ